uniref:Uncharacterized protein n=1 Tax=Acrobeloides nanus TaxID=290746 RepID=A0A914BZT8_9BILA
MNSQVHEIYQKYIDMRNYVSRMSKKKRNSCRNSNQVQNKPIDPHNKEKRRTFEDGTFEDGTFEDGTFEDGVNGSFEDGTFEEQGLQGEIKTLCNLLESKEKQIFESEKTLREFKNGRLKKFEEEAKNEIFQKVCALKEKIHQVQKQNAEYLSKIQDFEKTQINLTNRIQEKENKIIKLEEELKKERMDKISDIVEISKKMSELEEENSRLKKSVSFKRLMIQKLEAQLKDLKANDLERENEQLKGRNQHLNEEVKKIRVKIDKLEKSEEELKIYYDFKIQKLKTDFEKEIVEKEKIQWEFGNQILQLNAEKQEIAEKLDKELIEWQKRESQKEQIKILLLSQQQKIKIYEETINKMKKEIEEKAKIQHEALEAQNLLENQMMELQQKLDQEDGEKEKIQNEEMTIKHELENRIQELQEKLRNEYEEKVKIQIESVATKNDLENRNQVLQEKLDKECEEKVKIQNLHFTFKKSHENQVAQLKKDLTTQLDEKTKLQKLINDVEEEKKFLSELLENMKNQEIEFKNKYKKQYEVMKLNFDKGLFEKTEEIFELKKRIEEFEAKIVQLEDCPVLKLKISQLEEQISTENEEKMSLKNCLGVLNIKFENMIQEKAKLDETLQEKINEIAHLKKDAIKYAIENVYNEAKAKLGLTNQNVQPPKKKVRFMEKSVSELDKEVQAYKMSLEALASHFHEIYAENTNLKASFRNLINKISEKKCFSCRVPKSEVPQEIPSEHADRNSRKSPVSESYPILHSTIENELSEEWDIEDEDIDLGVFEAIQL